jgi:hypothetical protein
MQEYADKAALISEIRKTADLFIREFDDVKETDKDNTVLGVDRAPAQMIAYQLGWMALLRKWDAEELAGHVPEMPAPGLGFQTDEKENAPKVVFFNTTGTKFELYPLELLAKDINETAPPKSWTVSRA